MKKFLVTASYFSLLIPTSLVLAQERFKNLTGLAEGFKNFLDVLTTVVMALALIFFFWGLAKFILSAGDEEKKKEGRNIMIWGVIALAIMVAIWGVVRFLLTAFGIEEGGTIQVPKV